MAGGWRNRRGAKPAKPYDEKRSWNYVLWLLGRKAYTRAELEERLLGKGAAPEVVSAVLARLEEYRFVDDEAYAQGYVRAREPRKGKLALRQELLRKGVEEETVEGVLEPLGEAAQADRAEELLRKHAWRFRKEDPRKNRAKAFAFLARRGFAGGAAAEALERFLRDEQGGPDDA